MEAIGSQGLHNLRPAIYIAPKATRTLFPFNLMQNDVQYGKDHCARPSHVEMLKSEFVLRDLGRLPPEQFASMAKKDLAFYFQNPDALDRAISMGVILFDYASFHNYLKGSILELFLYRILEIYRKAKEGNQSACFELIGLWQPKMAIAHQNFACTGHLERSKCVDRFDLLVKICFQEMGDIIEGTIKTHMKLLCGMSRISSGTVCAKNIADDIEHMSLGETVAKLVGMHEDYFIIYKGVLKGVSLNQWRNIANHAAYLVIPGEKIMCHYGKENEFEITLDRAELMQVYNGIHSVWRMQKMAHHFFFCDNIDRLSPFLPKYQITDDSISIQIVELCYLQGYEVVSCRKSMGIWNVQIRDQLGRDVHTLKSSFDEAMNPLVRFTEGKLLVDVICSGGRSIINAGFRPAG